MSVILSLYASGGGITILRDVAAAVAAIGEKDSSDFEGCGAITKDVADAVALIRRLGDFALEWGNIIANGRVNSDAAAEWGNIIANGRVNSDGNIIANGRVNSDAAAAVANASGGEGDSSVEDIDSELHEDDMDFEDHDENVRRERWGASNEEINRIGRSILLQQRDCIICSKICESTDDVRYSGTILMHEKCVMESKKIDGIQCIICSKTCYYHEQIRVSGEHAMHEKCMMETKQVPKNCGICLEEFKSGWAKALSCGHVFCVKCLRSAFQEDARCPYCKIDQRGFTF